MRSSISAQSCASVPPEPAHDQCMTPVKLTMLSPPVKYRNTSLASYGVLEPAASAPPPLAPAAAEEGGGFTMSYTFIELGYFSTDLDTLGNSSNAWGG